MDLEIENVLKFDFYNEKLAEYSEVNNSGINFLLQFRGLNLISQEYFDKCWEFFGSFYVKLIEKNMKITYKYKNMMEEIFDIAFDADVRSLTGEYIEEKKLKEFNKDIEELVNYADDYIDGLTQILDDLSLYKMFCTDMLLLSLIESDFNDLYNKVEYIEKNMGNFEDNFE